MDGAIILDKPAGITSFLAVRKVRGLLGGGKVGHLGTLDPLGTGVLPLLVGRATRLAQFYLDHKREYVADVRFGWATSSYDSQGEVVGTKSEVALDAAGLEQSLDMFRGEIQLIPPPVSAKKVDGVRAYKLARTKRQVELEPVKVEIHELELLGIAGTVATLRCLCSAGTYMRSLAHEVGVRMGCGAHVAALRRTRVGDFHVEDAFTLEALDAMRGDDCLEDALIALTQLLPELPVHRVDAAVASRIGHGHNFQVSPFGACREARLVKAVGPDGRLLCLGKAVSPLLFHPLVVFQ